MERLENYSRRDFLRTSAMATAAMAFPAGVFAQSTNVLKVGVIGCGGRGTGAAMDAVAADPSVVIWAMHDVFPDRLQGSRNSLKDNLKDKYQVPDSRAFTGFNGYRGVLESGVDAVILTAPPGFRPEHFRASVDAGKHVFMEKPVAVDGPGVRKVLEACDLATSKGLNVVAGTQRRHDVAYREAMRRIHEGDIGDVVALYGYWNQGGLWMNPRQPDWSDMEWQLRNWLYFTWLSGDIIVEQHVHNIDVCNWAMRAHPVKAISLAGRQVRTDPAYGHVYDHFATEFEYENGVKMISMCRQIDGTASRVSEQVVGTKGTSNGQTSIKGEKAWRWEGDRPNPYVEEHKHLYQAIRNGTKINEGRQVTESVLTAIMGRMAGYTGQEITWDAALNSQESLYPAKVEMGEVPVAPVAVPGKTRLA
ncbi:MAG TPA: Gfo/Idh/MocA family oxidoreductase [Fimbriimonas sp.]